MNDYVISVLIWSTVVAVISRAMIYAYSPEEITRLQNGAVHWIWCMFNNGVRIVAASLASTAVYIIFLQNSDRFDDVQKVAIAAMAAVPGELVWNAFGKKVKALVDKWLSNGSGNETDGRDRRSKR